MITDIRLPTANGIDLASRLVDEHPGLIVVILSAYDDEHYVRAATGGRSLGIPAEDPAEPRVGRRAAGGVHRGWPPHRSAAGPGEKDTDGAFSAESLTARETAVVRLVARGMSNKAIAQQLGISPRTVEGHLNHVFDKLGVFSRTELVHYALANSLFVRGAPTVEGATDGSPTDRVPPTAVPPTAVRPTRVQRRIPRIGTGPGTRGSR